MRALVIDDSQDSQEILRGGLELMSFAVETCALAEEGLETARRKHPDLILLDLNLPDKNGWEVLNQLKQQPETEMIPVIMVTAATSMEAQRKAFELGAADYLVKPLDLNILTARSKTHAQEYERRRTQELEIKNASHLQRRFLASSDRSLKRHFTARNLDLEVFSQAADNIAGDFYFPKRTRHKGSLGFFLGDACGHGLVAGLLSMRIMSFLDSMTSPSWHPSELLDSLNFELSRLVPSDTFIAASYSIFTESTAILSNAGLPQPIMIRGGEVFELPIVGMPLGPESQAFRSEAVTKFDKGDKLLLLTDGIPECVGPNGEHFGEQRLLALCRQHCELRPYNLVRKIFDALVEFRGAPRFEDDVTLIAIERV